MELGLLNCLDKIARSGQSCLRVFLEKAFNGVICLCVQ